MSMPRRLSPTLLALAAATAATAAVAVSPAAPAYATTAGRPSAVTVHLDLASGQQPENLVLSPDGAAVVTFAFTGQVAEVRGKGSVKVLAQLPVPADGDTPVLHSKTFAAGIDRVGGTLYVALSTGTADATGIWRISPGQPPARIAVLPADSLLNGLTIDARRRWIYVADSVGAAIWRVPLSGGAASRWYTSDALAPSAGFLGVNGLKLHDGALWATNLDDGTLLRIPVHQDGSPGRATTAATGLGTVDDFAFTGRGDEVLATDNQDNLVLRVRPRSAARPAATAPVLAAQDGLSNPTAVAIRDGRVTVTSAAYFTQRDPNVTTVREPR